ncbi:MAG: D-xylose ABC transporter ATP-binding protein [Spirochaetes bacterium]|nr:MAG: D-xylose ABC transporter ATP-binding protein [Spirochaetota bacterium]
MSKEKDIALEIRGLDKTYPGVHALKNVSLSFRKGEIHGLIGENGAGKSTLVKILAGVVKADAGSIFINGNTAEIKSSRDARNLGLSFIHQELNLVDFLNACENIFLGHPYPRTPWGTISWKKLKQKALSILEKLGAKIPLNVPVLKLSAVNKSMVEIARAFAEEASIYFMDEPTTSLTENEKKRLFSVIQNLKSMGCTIVYISHQLDDVLDLAERVTVMRDGSIIETVDTENTTKEKLIYLMTGKDLSSVYPAKNAVAGEIVLQAEALSGAGINNVSFKLRRGEIIGIAGLVGSGRTELLKLIFGIERITGGNLIFRDCPFRPVSPKHSIRNRIVYLPEERRTQGLILNRSIYENITLVYLHELSSGPFLHHERNKIESEKIGESVRLKTSDYNNPVNTLSGGNQQKVLFAKYLLRKPEVLLLDEPTRGVDVGARFEIYNVIQDFAQQGTGILLVSSDFTELIGLSDKLLVLFEGNQIALIENRGLSEENLLIYCYGRN